MVPLKKLPAPSLPTGTDQPALATGRKAVLVSEGGKGTGHSQQPYAPLCISNCEPPRCTADRLDNRTRTVRSIISTDGHHLRACDPVSGNLL